MPDWNKVLQDRPDVRAEYDKIAPIADKNSPWYAQHGLDKGAEGFAEWWYGNKPATDTYKYDLTPGSATPPVVTPPPTTPVVPPTAGPGAGATTTPGGNRDSALQQAKLRARLTLQSQGLNPDIYMPKIEGYLTDIYNIIPATEMNASSYFDPNIAQNFISGETATKRAANRKFVQGALSRPNLEYSALDATISRILEGSIKESTDYLDRGKARGQFNDAGYKGGLTKLEGAKSKARAKLQGYASDLYGEYDSKFNDVYDRALSAANNSGLEDFDITPYTGEYERLTQSAQQALPGRLESLIGDDPLIDNNSLRTGVALGQGTTNLKDLDVLDGLAKRKQANAAGRGIGSQGTF